MPIDPIVDSTYPKDVYELYNDRLDSDQLWVNAIVASIKYGIYYNVSYNLISNFQYGATEWIGTLDIQTQSRVMDQVIKYFRKRGIRVYLRSTYLFTNVIAYGVTQISNSANFLLVNVEWFVRDQEEFMKAYLD